ncbi:hypothetical protein [Corynebacterium stationis]|uniref:hypothetical protein n=1 Tax=Corynebacterium stationis TaxID=1705 RepID=UPI00076F7A90|nr:hypothetical protein [Corynebacterium stationis]AMJ43675.1 hypothetical protein AW169_01175 [Corynebacterium stationis]AQX70122.1 hypothetical protein CA21670_00300 [Corynebacterium stationis]ASJ17826.1 hypothetical protein BA700_01175 [Corynebacterium stationis]
MKKKSGKCVDCSKSIRLENKRCKDCYSAHRKAGKKVYICARCGGFRSRTADTEHCMACSHEIRREEYAEQCQITREDYDFLRSKGLTNHQAMKRLMASMGKAYSTIHRHLSEAETFEEIAA